MPLPDRPYPTERDRLGRVSPHISKLSDLYAECVRALEHVFPGAPSMTLGGEAAHWIFYTVGHHGLSGMCDVALLERFGDDGVVETWESAREAVESVRQLCAEIARVSGSSSVRYAIALSQLRRGERPDPGYGPVDRLLERLVASGYGCRRPESNAAAIRRCCLILGNLLADLPALHPKFVRGDRDEPASWYEGGER